MNDLTNGILNPICKKIFKPLLCPHIISETKKKQEKILNDIRKELEDITHVKCKDVKISTNYYSKKESAKLVFEIDSLCSYVNDPKCELQFDDEHYCFIELGYQIKYYFKNAQQIIELRDAIQKAAIIADKKYEIAEGEALKKDKIKAFKKAAILSKILELVQLERVPYIIDQSFTTKIVVFIRLSDSVRLEVNVPYSNYQIVLQNTQAAIQAMREFADKGIAINVRTSPSTTPYYDWIKPN